MRVYVYDPSKRPEPKPAVMPPADCELCGECLGEKAHRLTKFCAGCRRKMDVARRNLRRRRKVR